MLKATGERVVPELQRGELVYAEHLVRYRLAAQFAQGRRVLDVGSGEGYGTALLAASGAVDVTGIDLDEAAVAHARERYGLRFEQADAARLPFANGSFDLVICFETIEHLENDERAVLEMRRVLADEGLLLISTPNREEYLVENEFHKREYSLEEFDALLAEHFPHRLSLYQQNWLFSGVFDVQTLAGNDEENPLPINLVKVVGIEPERALYSVMMCGPNAKAPEPIAVLTGVFEANRMSAELAMMNTEIDTLSAEIQRLSAELEKVPELLGKLDAWIERARTAEHLREVYEKRGDEWQERATIAERQQEAWERRAGDAERQIEQLNDAIREIEQSLSWRLTTPLRATKQMLRR
jgi:SAM-dependent methyltransferase